MSIMAGIIFGGIGFVFFVYGKKQASPKPMVIGIVLMVYPYFVSNTILLYVIGVLLSVAAFVFRD